MLVADAYLGLGSNLGNTHQQLTDAIAQLAKSAGNIVAVSDFYETPPWGYQSSNPFLNIAVHIETSLTPHELLAITQHIEQELGRISKTCDRQYADRLIDIDILMYDGLILQNSDLVLPHPLMHHRLFVLQPLAEIAPDVRHPLLNKTMLELYKNNQENCLIL